MFEITFNDPDVADEPNSLVMDVYIHIDYKGSDTVKEMLIAHHADGSFEPITIGQLKMVPRIFLWLVSRVLCLKNGVF